MPDAIALTAHITRLTHGKPRQAGDMKALREAAGAVRAAAFAGMDLSAAIAKLTRALLDPRLIHVAQPMADALVALHVREHAFAALDQLDAALATKKLDYLVLPALNAVDGHGFDILPALKVLLRPEFVARHKLAQLRSLLAGVIARDPPGRLTPTVDLLRAASPGSVPGLIVDLQLGRRLEVSAVLHHLIAILQTGPADAQLEAAMALQVAADRDHDLAAHLPALNRLLLSASPPIAEKIAQALARQASIAGDWNGVDALAQSSPPIRAGTCQSLGNLWTSGRLDRDEIASRLARMLVDPDERVRGLALAALIEGARARRQSLPDPPSLQAVIERMLAGAISDQAATGLHLIASSSPISAQRLLAALADAPERPPFTQLARLCRGDAPDQAARCSICRQLPRSSAWAHALSAPIGYRLLVPVPARDLGPGEIMLRCPECETCYVDGYRAEVDVNSMREDFWLRRLAPSQARRHLTLTHYDQRIEAWRQKLGHLDPAERMEAAWVMALHWMDTDVVALEGQLLDHADAGIRREALRTLAEQPQAPLLTASRLLRGIEDSDPDIRCCAAQVLTRQSWQAGDGAIVAGLIRHSDARASFGALMGAWQLQAGGHDLAALIEPIREATQHNVDDVRRMAAMLLQKMPRQLVNPDTLTLATQNLWSGFPNLREQGLDMLAAAARQGVDVSAVADRLGELLLDRNTAFSALQTLGIAVQKGVDISAAYPSMATALRDPANVANWNLQQFAAGQLHRDGAADLIRAFIALCEAPRDDRHMPLMSLLEAAKAGADLSPGRALFTRIAEGACNATQRELAAKLLMS